MAEMHHNLVISTKYLLKYKIGNSLCIFIDQFTMFFFNISSQSN